MKKTIIAIGLSALASVGALAQTPVFTPGNLAVLELGDNGTNRGATADDIWASRQNPYYVLQFDPGKTNQVFTNASYHPSSVIAQSVTVAVPTNGSGAMWCNGNAGTEGNLVLSGDKSVLTFGGYQGDICSIFPTALPTPPVAPSNLSYDRGIGQVDAFGNYVNVLRSQLWYGVAQGKTNPRGVTTDGAGHYWGCGNGYGNLFYDSNVGGDPVKISDLVLPGCAKVINGTLYAAVKSGSDAKGQAAGIYSFVDFNLNPVPLPISGGAVFAYLQIPADALNQNCVGFDINPSNNVAYIADTKNGICKYVKTGANWKLAYLLQVSGYSKYNNGILSSGHTNGLYVGTFSVAVDWTKTNPVIYATTGDSPGADPRDAKAGALTYYANRVVAIVDTNTATSGAKIPVTNNTWTVAQAPVYNPSAITNSNTNLYIVFKSVAFTPDLRPNIATNPVGWTAQTGNSPVFTVSATGPSGASLAYQWQTNGVNVAGATSPSLTFGPVVAANNGLGFRCIVADTYGSVTSSVANLTVAAPAAPSFVAINGSASTGITNYVGFNFTLTPTIGGTDPKGGYQWYANGVALADGNEFSGTQTPVLSIVNAQTNDTAIYSLGVTNAVGSNYFTAANLTVTYAPPVFLLPPVAQTVFQGRPATFTATISSYNLTHKWYKYVTTATTTNLVAVPVDGASYVQTDTSAGAGRPATSTLTIASTVANDGTNYVLVSTNISGAVTSPPVSLSLYIEPASHSFAPYKYAGQTYVQNFDSLPIPGGGSAEQANPLDVTYVITNPAMMLTNNSFADTNMSTEVTYSLGNPADLAYPIVPSGGIGGLNLTNTMAGWYAWGQKSPLLLGMTSGDQSEGGIIDQGLNYNNINGLTYQPQNRSLGLLTSTASGIVAFGVGFTNTTSQTFNNFSLAFTGELWRNNPDVQQLAVGYAVDSGSPASFNTVSNAIINGPINSVDALAVTFPTAVSTVILDGTQTANQTNAAVKYQAISGGWAPGTVLWVFWYANSTITGGAQDVAVDNVNFSAYPATPVAVTQPSLSGVSYSGGASGSGAGFRFTNTPGAAWQFQVWGTTNLSQPFSQWQYLGNPSEGPAGTYTFGDIGATNQPQKFYRVVAVTP